MKTILFKPFDRWSEKILLTIGITTSIAGILLAHQFNGRFDGALDLHFARETTLSTIALELLIDFASLFLFLFIAAKWINRKTRVVDILSAILISKIPMYLLLVFNAGGALAIEGDRIAQQAISHQPVKIDMGGMALIIVFAIITLLCIVWSIALLYNGYKTASNAKGGKPIILFIIALLLAEILSSVLIWQIHKQEKQVINDGMRTQIESTF